MLGLLLGLSLGTSEVNVVCEILQKLLGCTLMATDGLPLG